MLLIDLRSDTVTRPTEAMRRAMAGAEVGDDVFGDDPTVNQLEAVAAERLGFPASLFTASGTMSNLLAILTHGERSDEAIVGANSHIFLNEVGGAAGLAGVQLRPVEELPDGSLTIDEFERVRRGQDIHWPRTRLLCLENTHNYRGGRVLDPGRQAAVTALAHQSGVAVHLDGARLFNAAVASGRPVADLTAGCDSVGVCLSKALAAPVGSILAGSAAFVGRARSFRKMVGGGMRQAGVLAAAGLVALDQMVDRLAEDHQRARQLAESLAAIPGIKIEPELVETNIVFFEPVSTPVDQVVESLRTAGILVGGRGRSIRLVTHYQIDDEAIERAVRAINQAVTPPQVAMSSVA